MGGLPCGPESRKRRRNRAEMKIAVLVSGGGTNLQAIIDAIAAGELEGVEITGVIASRKQAYALERAARAGIPAKVVRLKDFADRYSFDRALAAAVKSFAPDYVILAGYLNKIGPPLLQAYPNRILNIHPALLPAHGGEGMYGLKPHEAVLAAGEKFTGATVHLVNEDYDRGRILLQKIVKVKEGDDANTLQQRVMAQAEWFLYPEVLRRLSRLYPAGPEALPSEIIEADE